MKTEWKSIKNGWKHIYYYILYACMLWQQQKKQQNHNQHHQSKSYQRNASPKNKLYIFNLTNAITDCSLSNRKRV